MLRSYLLSIPLSAAMTGLLPAVSLAALDPGYLAGKWEINAQGSCGANNGE